MWLYCIFCRIRKLISNSIVPRALLICLGEYRQALEDAVKKTSALFDDYRQVVENTLSDILTMREAQDKKMADLQQMFEYQQKMIDRIGQWLMSESPQNPVTGDEQPYSTVVDVATPDSGESTNNS